MMTKAQAELLYMQCRWKRNGHRLTVRKWEQVSDEERAHRLAVRIWIEAMEAVAVEVLTAPEPQDYGFMTEDDYAAQIERDGYIVGTVVA